MHNVWRNILLAFCLLCFRRALSQRPETEERNVSREISRSDSAISLQLGLSFLKPMIIDDVEVDFIRTALGIPGENGRNVTGVLPQLGFSGNVTETCLRDSLTYLQDLIQFKTHAVQMRSSYATLPSLFSLSFTGRLKYEGNYELCRQIKTGVDGAPFDGQYCSAKLPIPSGHQVVFGICTPKSCRREDLSVIANSVLANINIHRGLDFICVDDVPWTIDSVLVAFLLSVLATCVLIGTVYEVTCHSRWKKGTKENDEHKNGTGYELKKLESLQKTDRCEEGAVSDDQKVQDGVPLSTLHEPPNEQKANGPTTRLSRKKPPLYSSLTGILTSFSLVSNGRKILSTEISTGTLGALHGIRVLCMVWIIWGHTNLYLVYGRLDNFLHLLNNVSVLFWYRTTLKASYAVDVFFMISGLLLTFITLKNLQAYGKKANWLSFYIRRYFRLTPTYMVAIGIWTSLLVHLSDGPQSRTTFTYEKSVCTNYWWANLLYISNLFSYPSKQCMSWSWYLANDWQFFVISPLFLILLCRRRLRILGALALVLVTVSSCTITALLIAKWGFPLGNLLTAYREAGSTSGNVDDRVYSTPWTRIQTYTLGMLVGYILHRKRGKKVAIPLILNLIGWFMSITIMLALVFGLYSSGKESDLPKWLEATWHGVDRLAFTSCVAWIVFACVTGNGGPVNKFLCWGFWVPLSRLTFCCYLLHPMIIILFLFNKKTSLHWSAFEITYFFIGNTVVSFCLAFCLALLVETPSVGLIKTLLR